MDFPFLIERGRLELPSMMDAEEQGAQRPEEKPNEWEPLAGSHHQTAIIDADDLHALQCLRGEMRHRPTDGECNAMKRSRIARNVGSGGGTGHCMPRPKRCPCRAFSSNREGLRHLWPTAIHPPPVSPIGADGIK